MNSGKPKTEMDTKARIEELILEALKESYFRKCKLEVAKPNKRLAEDIDILQAVISDFSNRPSLNQKQP